ncbi:MAG: HAD family hydrolase [Erysipelotrichaceae bacterium]|nr:HAD family hydrolase [Erysipelotrichaceae bacterium]
MKIIVSDFDNTITKNRIILKENKEAVKKFREAGNLFFICSGRGKNARRGMGGIERDGLLMASGSAMEIGDEVIESYFEKGVIKEVYSFIKKNYPSHVTFNGNSHFVYCLKFYFKKLKNKDLELYDDVTSITSFLFNKKRMLNEANDLNKLFKGKLNTFPNSGCVDIVPPNVSKANTCDFIKNKYGVDKVYVIGDNLNDLEMIERHKGACVSSGLKEVKEKATYVYDSLALYIEDILNEKI